MPSNRGSEKIGDVLDDVSSGDLTNASRIMWEEARSHPSFSTCVCPGIEFLCALYEQGYRLVKE